ncbi:hypothetical protein KIL84_000373 [Mauremys mutica]|uniref:Uncharacterized protein n=1 Tax=Mauremys mutica TaxID=74926 RepID=A0A9D3XG45_9SAUR|nr:hypothetical protein KIL84_000373 [Mauremys mutica]
MIRRFLTEDSEEAELAQFLKEFPSGESFRKVELEEGKRAPGQGPVDPGVFSSVAQPIADELLDEKELRPFSRPWPLDFQQHIAAPAPLSPSRPRSPWGKLDPYDSSEVQCIPGQASQSTRSSSLWVAGGRELGGLYSSDLLKDLPIRCARRQGSRTLRHRG